VKWTPEGKYCRSCGAAVVAEELFGAARMLKDAGTDRFTIPKLLVELDRDQIENFSRIYQRHAVAVARHVNEARWLEQFLVQRGWSESLEDELLAQLPLPELRLDLLSGVERLDGATLEVARRIREKSPFDTTRSMAAITCVLLEDFAGIRDVETLLYSDDAKLREEALLALTHWSVFYQAEFDTRARDLVAMLRKSDASAARVRLAMIERKGDATAVDSDSAFMLAIAHGDVDSLRAALDSADSAKQFVASKELARLGFGAMLEPALRSMSASRQVAVLETLSLTRKPVPELGRLLMEFAERTVDIRLARKAARLAATSCPPEELPRLIRVADSSVVQAVLQSSTADSATLDAVGTLLIELGRFQADQFGMQDAAKPGRMPSDFVPRRFHLADDETRRELLAFAEMQLTADDNEELHRFLVHTALGEASATVHAKAWSCLFRWYERSGLGKEPPLRLAVSAAERFYGSVREMAKAVVRFLSHSESLQELFVWDRLWKFLHYADSEFVCALSNDERDSVSLMEALAGVMKDEDQNFQIRLAAVELLSKFNQTVLGHRSRELLVSFFRSDLDHACRSALERG
jgi:hypothetical protein